MHTMLDEAEITPETFAFCEGMRDWRSVKEALVWAEAKGLGYTPAEVEPIVSGRFDSATACLEMKNLLLKKQVFPLFDSFDTRSAIVDLNRAARSCMIQFAQGQSSPCLVVFPAQELLLTYVELSYPRDWERAWQQAGGDVYDGRLIARKDDDVWTRLSDYGLPFPPFSLELGMNVRDVRRSEAVGFGVIEQGDEVEPVKLPDRAPWILIGSPNL